MPFFACCCGLNAAKSRPNAQCEHSVIILFLQLMHNKSICSPPQKETLSAIEKIDSCIT
jgi:hypothetical protein